MKIASIYQKTPVECSHGYVFDQSMFTETVISEYNLVCDMSYVNVLGTSVYFIGNFFGSLAFGNFADKYGRKFTALTTFALSLACSFAMSYSTSVTMYIVMRGLSSMFAYGTAAGTYVYSKGRHNE